MPAGGVGCYGFVFRAEVVLLLLGASALIARQPRNGGSWSCVFLLWVFGVVGANDELVGLRRIAAHRRALTKASGPPLQVVSVV